jgi:hypothetical protein
MKRSITLFCAALFLAASACSSKTPKAQIGRAAQPLVTEAPNLTNTPAWNWDAYPAVRRMKLATLPCLLQPRSQITINSTLAGSLKIYIDQPQTNMEAGKVWGEFEPTIFELEADSFEEARQKLDEREKILTELEIPKQKLKLEREIEEAQRQVDYLRYITTHPDSADLILRAGDKTSVMRPDSLVKAQSELGLLNQSLVYLNETNTAALGVDLAGLRSEWKRRKVEFERRRAQATLKMPFTGQLTVSLPLAEGVAEYPVNIGQELAVARDLSVVRLRVAIGNSAWNSLTPDKLVAMIRLPNGQELEAQYSYHKIERQQNREESAYYFQFLPEHTQLVARLIGTDVTCELWYNLAQPTRIVPKLALIMHNKTAFQAGNWGAGLNAAFPGARVAVEGQTDLGIVLPKTEVKQASK